MMAERNYNDISHKELDIVADLVHDVWAKWTHYFYSRCWHLPFGIVVIPPALSKRWKRQAATDFKFLPEGEKQSDYEIAESYINTFDITRGR